MTPVALLTPSPECTKVEIETKTQSDKKEVPENSQKDNIQQLFSALINKKLGPICLDERAPTSSETETWITNKFNRWKNKTPQFTHLKEALIETQSITIMVDQNGTKDEIQERIQRLGTLLYLLEKENALQNKKITIVLPNSDFSPKRKIIGTIMQLANIAFAALITWALVTQVPTSWMPNDGPWTAENTWFRNLLPPGGMGLMIGTAAIFSLPSYINTCPSKDRLGFMAKFQHDERIAYLVQRGRDITSIFSETPINRRTCTFRWQ